MQNGCCEKRRCFPTFRKAALVWRMCRNYADRKRNIILSDTGNAHGKKREGDEVWHESKTK